MANILFINPPNKPFTDEAIAIEPVDSLVLASYVEHLGHKVNFLDMDRRKLCAKDIELSSYSHVVLLFDYHIPLHTSEAQDEILSILTLCKEKNVFAILGGKIPQHSPEEFLDSGASIVVVGEMELALKEILAMEKKREEMKGIIYKDKGKLIRTEEREEKISLDELVQINRNLVSMDEYIDTRTILTSRGCFNTCSFCPVPVFWGKWRARSVSRVVDEIESLVRDWGQKKILFLDDNAVVNRFRMREISKEILKRKIKVYLGCLGTISSLDRETLLCMYKAGFRWIHFGVESGDQSILDEMRKGVTIEQIRKIILESKKIGFRVRASFIYDFPNITEEGVEKTNALIQELEPQEIRIHFLTLKVGTSLYEHYHREGESDSQYIHNNQPNVCSTLSKDIFVEKLTQLSKNLEKKGYQILSDVKEFRDVKKLKERNPELKLLTFCPLRYGLGWEDEK
ncbi:B12-binding domain-containing radical SAM protein [Candidatus Woesearchaeota archaeon]|nr:B12-binding domain-containing radical SAM protein [Nanoarchaeota archaeon]MCB9370245.1 B12-binding domain-containing radical SAM protein [Candidatus Woesearchaeota archaeon]USN44770.1 MAG: B12-binding domain-containing radical SAM protein [Candidatus Woesearchaeota archaeon]